MSSQEGLTAAEEAAEDGDMEGRAGRVGEGIPTSKILVNPALKLEKPARARESLPGFHAYPLAIYISFPCSLALPRTLFPSCLARKTSSRTRSIIKFVPKNYVINAT